jgi:hypothetical protein
MHKDEDVQQQPVSDEGLLEMEFKNHLHRSEGVPQWHSVCLAHARAPAPEKNNHICEEDLGP